MMTDGNDPNRDRYDGESDSSESDDEDVGSKELELLLGEDYGPLQERIRKCQMTNPVVFLFYWQQIISDCKQLPPETRQQWEQNMFALERLGAPDGWKKTITRFRKKPTSAKRLKAIFEWSQPVRDLSDSHTAASVQAQKVAYDYPFQGDAATCFLQYILDSRQLIKAIHPEKKEKKEPVELYSQSVSVVQSSGTGKSRMMREVGKQVLTIPMCIREGTHDWPVTDIEVYDFLKGLDNHHLNMQTHYGLIAFLRALMSCALDKLKELNKIANGQRTDLINLWHKDLESQEDLLDNRPRGRRNFFENVIRNARKYYDDYQKETLDAKTDKLYKSKDLKDKVSALHFVMQKLVKAHVYPCLHLLTKFLTEDLPATSDAVPNGVKQRLIILVFDEANSLGKRYWALQRILRAVLTTYDVQDKCRLWVVFVATSFTVSRFTPATGDASALKVATGSLDLLPPFVALGFDHGVHEKMKTHKSFADIKMGEMEKLEWLAMYGRPMWMSLLEAQTPSLVNLAASKLLNIGGSFVSTLFNTQDLHHVLAVLSSRIRLDTIIHSHAATQVTDKAVSSHMRILSVSHDQVFRQSYSPSEPILSLGAAEVLMSAPKHYPRSIKKLAEQLGASYIDRGRFEEMMGRLVTVCARDLQTKSLDHNAPWWRPIRLLDFLDTLLGHDWGLNEMQVAEKVKFKNKFADSYINFTHWTKMNDPIDWKTDLKLLANMWSRHVALQCCDNQYSFDLVMVVYNGSVEAGAPFIPSLLCAFVWQIRFRQDGFTDVQHKIQPLPSRSIEPFLCFFWDMGCEQAHHQSNFTSDNCAQAASKSRNRNQAGSTPSSSNQKTPTPQARQHSPPEHPKNCVLLHVPPDDADYAACQKVLGEANAACITAATATNARHVELIEQKKSVQDDPEMKVLQGKENRALAELDKAQACADACIRFVIHVRGTNLIFDQLKAMHAKVFNIEEKGSTLSTALRILLEAGRSGVVHSSMELVESVRAVDPLSRYRGDSDDNNLPEAETMFDYSSHGCL